MSLRIRLLVLSAAIVGLLLVPYFIWHEPMDAYFASAEYRQWLESIRPYAWLIAILLLASDTFLPVPAAPVVATVGALYGALVGGIVAAVGLILAGLVGFATGRILGEKALRRLANDAERRELQAFFDSWGAIGIVATRALPVVPEVLTMLAGASRMHVGRLLLALALGSIPMGSLLAWVGSQVAQSSGLLLVLTLIPAGLWCVYLLLMARLRSKSTPQF